MSIRSEKGLLSWAWVNGASFGTQRWRSYHGWAAVLVQSHVTDANKAAIYSRGQGQLRNIMQRRNRSILVLYCWIIFSPWCRFLGQISWRFFTKVKSLKVTCRLGTCRARLWVHDSRTAIQFFITMLVKKLLVGHTRSISGPILIGRDFRLTASSIRYEKIRCLC